MPGISTDGKALRKQSQNRNSFCTCRENVGIRILSFWTRVYSFLSFISDFLEIHFRTLLLLFRTYADLTQDFKRILSTYFPIAFIMGYLLTVLMSYFFSEQNFCINIIIPNWIYLNHLLNYAWEKYLFISDLEALIWGAFLSIMLQILGNIIPFLVDIAISFYLLNALRHLFLLLSLMIIWWIFWPLHLDTLFLCLDFN